MWYCILSQARQAAIQLCAAGRRAAVAKTGGVARGAWLSLRVADVRSGQGYGSRVYNKHYTPLPLRCISKQAQLCQWRIFIGTRTALWAMPIKLQRLKHECMGNL